VNEESNFRSINWLQLKS